jgi:hypothetical protein
MKHNRYDANKKDQHRRSMKIMKAKSMTTMILFLVLSLALSGIVSAQITKITENTYADTSPQTAGGYVVWQARVDGDWEIFLYNANDNTGPFQITDNTYDDIAPNTDGRYVTWTAASAPNGEIFIYDIATSITTQITDNTAHDANPKVFNGRVVWLSKALAEFTLAPGDIFLYDIASGTTTNVSALLDPTNIYDDYGFRFDGQQIFWIQHDFQLESSANYLYDLATGSISRYHTPLDEEDFIPYLEDLATGAITLKPGGLRLQNDPRVDGDFLVFTSMIDGNREIVIRDKKNKHGGPITANDTEDTQPSIGDYIVAWKGDRGDDAEIYTYVIPHLTLVSPDDGIECPKKEFPVFVWKAGGYIQFKIQFSTVPSFEGQYTLTFPEGDDAWQNEHSVTLDKEQVHAIKKLCKDKDKFRLLYWRVLAQDSSGNEEISQARHIIIIK